MELSTSVRRAFGGNDARFWRAPGFTRMRLRGDVKLRVAFAALIGIGVGGLVLAIVLAIAPPDQLGFAVLIGVGMMAAVAGVVFLYEDTVDLTIALEDEGIRRKIRHFWFNLIGSRNRNEFWQYQSISSCGIAPCARIGPKYSAFIVKTASEWVTMPIPANLSVQQVAEFLAGQDIRLQRLPQVPAEALPGKSIGSRGMKIGATLAVIGLVSIIPGVVARSMIYAEPVRLDMADVRAALENAPPGNASRQLTGVNGGVEMAEISPDGRWVWAQSTRDKKQFVWNDHQDTPAGELPKPAGDRIDVEFTPDSQRIVVVAQLEAQLWRLEPLESISTIPLDVHPDAMSFTADGKQLIAVMMSSIQLFDLETGVPGAKYPITLGAIVEAGLSEDGERLIIVQHPRILSVSLDNGMVEEMVAFRKPKPIYSKGSLSGGANFAALQGRTGTDVFDLRTGEQRSSLATGASYLSPTITSDGATLVVPAPKGLAVWDVATGKPVSQFPLTTSSRAAMSANNRRFIGYARRSPEIIVGEIP